MSLTLVVVVAVSQCVVWWWWKRIRVKDLETFLKYVCVRMFVYIIISAN